MLSVITGHPANVPVKCNRKSGDTPTDPGRIRSYKLNPNFTNILETSDEDNDAKTEVLERMWRKKPIFNVAKVPLEDPNEPPTPVVVRIEEGITR